MKKIVFGLLFATLSLMVADEVVGENSWPYVCESSDLNFATDKRYFFATASDTYPSIIADSKTIQIDRKNKTIKVWTAWLASEQERLQNVEELGAKYDNFGYNKYLFLINYATMKSQYLRVTSYSCNGSVVYTGDLKSDWIEITPESVMEDIVETLVARYKLK